MAPGSRYWVCQTFVFGLALLIASCACQYITNDRNTDPEWDYSTPELYYASTVISTGKNVVTTREICSNCDCNGPVVDCANMDLIDFFSYEYWAGLADEAPITVDLSNNALTEVSKIYKLPLQVLNLSHNEIVTIERASFRFLQSMTTLDLSYNNLTSANLSPRVFEGHYSPEQYEPLEAMRILNLAYNDLHSLNQDLFEHLPKLEELSLAGNPLNMIDHVSVLAISNLPLLKVLDLKGCQLEEIPDMFFHTPRYLEHLDLSDNHLHYVPEAALEEARSLKYLNLNNNPIRYIDQNSDDFNGFPLLPNLIELHLCNMPKLEEIRELSLGGLTGLTYLHISDNMELTSIAPHALARDDGESLVWPPLKELYIQNNSLSAINRRLVSRWDKLERIEVGFNPFLCDCSTQWMADTLVPLIDDIRVNASSNLICQEPIEMRGRTFKQIHDTEREMRCSGRSTDLSARRIPSSVQEESETSRPEEVVTHAYNNPPLHDTYVTRTSPETYGAILFDSLIGVLLFVPICLKLLLLYKKRYLASRGVRRPADLHKPPQTEDCHIYI